MTENLQLDVTKPNPQTQKCTSYTNKHQYISTKRVFFGDGICIGKTESREQSMMVWAPPSARHKFSPAIRQQA